MRLESTGIHQQNKENFNPRTPYGMRRWLIRRDRKRSNFNPRTPYGMRLILFVVGLLGWLFQSTHPLRDATVIAFWIAILILNFNPRTPYGMRHGRTYAECIHCRYFNPRTPYGMRPHTVRYSFYDLNISIHAPLTGCDVLSCRHRIHLWYFNPRTPYGMRHIKIVISLLVIWFQSTHPLRDATTL